MIETVLQIVGVIAIGGGIGKGIQYLWVKRPRISLKNPLKQYIRKEVINYLKELQDEK